MTVCAIILALLFPPTHPPKPPQGWLDCGFAKQNVYRCKPWAQNPSS